MCDVEDKEFRLGGNTVSKSVKLSDIANELGVSVVTISNALSGRKGVSDELREKIEAKADELGYIRNTRISEGKRESYNVGVVVSERYLGRTTSFYWELYQKLVSVASKKSSFTMLEVLSLEDEQNANLPAMILDNKIDGLVIIGRLSKKYLLTLNEQINVPMVFLDFYDDSISCDAIVSDNFYGMYRMTKYLINKGHKEIAFIGEIHATSSIMDRYLGYMKAMLEANLDIREEWLISDRDLEKGHMVVNLPNNLPTAFVCNCDLAAELLIEQLTEKGYEVPEDISVVGYDNFSYSSYINKNLTTYDVDTYRLARQCFHVLTKRIKNSSGHMGIQSVEGNMIIRNSAKEIG